MSRNHFTAAPELTKWNKDLEAFTSSYHALIQRVQALDCQVQDLTADLQNETNSRRLWQNRAEDVEYRVSKNQYVLLLVDGNQTGFRESDIQSGSAKTEELANRLVSEVREVARRQHSNDLSDDFAVVIKIFVDVERLSQDLMSTGSISSKQQLKDFLKNLTAAQALIAVVECGSPPTTMNERVKAFYELNIENCHCRHIILALGPHSDYYATLDMYSEDEFTKLKTSLVRPENGFLSQYSLPFDMATFSMLHTVQPISLSEIASDSNETGAENALEAASLADPPLNLQHASTSSNQTEPSSQQLFPAIDRPPNITSSQSSLTAKSRSSRSSSRKALMAKTPSSPLRPASAVPSNKSDSAVVDCPPQPDSYESELALLKEDWERRVGENSYAPPEITVAWGEENVVGGNSHNNVPDTDEAAWPAPLSDMPLTKTYGKPRRMLAQDPRDDYHPRPKAPVYKNSKTTLVRPHTGGIQTLRGDWDDQFIQDNPTSRAPAPISVPTEVFRKLRASGQQNQSGIALNRARQRIDLRLPEPSSEDWARFHARTKVQKLCNEHHLRSECHEKRCKYDHRDIDAGVLLALRHNGRRLPCIVGSGCLRHDCFNGHRCPYIDLPGGCRKKDCLFRKNGLHIQDSNVVEIIPSPENVAPNFEEQ
ncbi:hypothetical protein DV736_g4189, partial [Chaetothyriales sp. CBS 134916]